MTIGQRSAGLPIVLTQATIMVGELKIIDNLSLTISSGAPTVLIGPNGSGKTTLLRAAMGLTPLSRGRITWGGREDCSQKRRAMLFQRPTMLRRTTAANVRYAMATAGVPRSQRERRTADLLSRVGIGDLQHRPARALSDGEQQRLALARALALDPAVLFLDEPTASLDPYSTKAMEDVIRTVAASAVKLVISTHDLGQARRIGGEIVLLHRGRLIESGAAEAFFSTPRTGEARKFIAGELLV